MRIFLYVPGMPFNGELIHTLSLGGSETAGHGLAKALAALGHEVAVFCNTPVSGSWEGVVYHPIGRTGEAAPFGENFERHARVIPHDVLIAQRVPGIFARPYAATVNLWWTHDLATVRSRDAVKAGLWNCQGILAVSAFHARQVTGVLGLPAGGGSDGYVTVVPNAIDAALFEPPVPPQDKLASRTLVYTSRPERGLEHLVRPGGIMERLASRDPGLLLLVAGYDNTVLELAPLYRELWARCEALPNVQWLGALAKRQVADLFRRAWLHVYPVVSPGRFEEVSCISAMEAQAGGTPVLACANGALPETLSGGGAQLLDYVAGGSAAGAGGEAVDEDGFVRAILSLAQHPAKWQALHEAALAKSRHYRWEASAGAVIARVEGILRAGVQRPPRLARHLLYTSDVLACRDYISKLPVSKLAARLPAAQAEAQAETQAEAAGQDIGALCF